MGTRLGGRQIQLETTGAAKEPLPLSALLAKQAYGQLAEVLERYWPTAGDPGLPKRHTLLKAAYQLSLAADAATAEIQHHERARAAAVAHEQDIRASLAELIVLLEEELVVGGHGRERHASPPPPTPAISHLPHRPQPPKSAAKTPHLTVQMFGTFRAYINQQPITDWKGNKSKLLFKYMVLHRARPLLVERLIDTFWQDEEPNSARRSLYQAIYLLRQALQSADVEAGFILSSSGAYGLNSAISVWLDTDTFTQHVRSGIELERAGNTAEAIAQFELAEQLYEGDFLGEDIYEDWTSALRDALRQDYLHVLDRLGSHTFAQQNWPLCITYTQKTLKIEPCHEAAHQRLMQIHVARGQRHLALRQYHTCVNLLDQELGVAPTPQTTSLYQQLHQAPSSF